MRFDSQYKCGVVTKNIILSYNNPVKERLFKYKIKSLIYLLVRKGKRNEPSGYLRATKPNQIKSVLKKNFILCIYMYYYLLSFDFSVAYACILCDTEWKKKIHWCTNITISAYIITWINFGLYVDNIYLKIEIYYKFCI